MSASVSNENVPILNLPWEIQDKILAYVGDPALTAKVCHLWRTIVASDNFYANILDTIRRCCGSSEAFNRLKACAYVEASDGMKAQAKKIYQYLSVIYRAVFEKDKNGVGLDPRYPYLMPGGPFNCENDVRNKFAGAVREISLDPRDVPLSKKEELCWKIIKKLSSLPTPLSVERLGAMVVSEQQCQNLSLMYFFLDALEKVSPEKIAGGNIKKTLSVMHIDIPPFRDDGTWWVDLFAVAPRVASALRQDLSEKGAEIANLFADVHSFSERMDLTFIVLPMEFADIMPNLRFLKLSSHKIRTLPPSLGKLKKLETINLRGNAISDIPDYILNDLPNLKRLNIELTPMERRNLERVFQLSDRGLEIELWEGEARYVRRKFVMKKWINTISVCMIFALLVYFVTEAMLLTRRREEL